MNIKFVGTGGAFEPHKGNSSAIVEHNDTKILIDCGYATLERLITKNLVADLDYVLITHLHADHVGSLPSLLAYYDLVIGKQLPVIYTTEQQKADIHQLLTLTWEENRTFYVPITDFPWISFIDTFGLHFPEKQTFAYYFSDETETVLYSGDLGSLTPIETFLAEHKEQKVRTFLEVNKKDGAIHIFYKEAQEKLKDYEVYGYHCDKATMPEDCALPLVEDYPELNY